MKKHRSPGPAAYTVPDFLSISRRSISFGTAGRDKGQVMIGNASPGPTIALPPTMGRGKDLTIPNAGNIHFGSAERLPAASIAHAAPGPGTYPLPPQIGPHDPTKKRLPAFGFGTSARLPGQPAVPKRLDPELEQRMAKAATGKMSSAEATMMVSNALLKLAEMGSAPGPGAYDTGMWKRKAIPSVPFSSAPQRPQPSLKATKAPGPGQYGDFTTIGPHAIATIKNVVPVTFGSSRHTRRHNDPGPGPGQYPLPSSIGPQGANKRSMPSYRFGQTPRETGVYD